MKRISHILGASARYDLLRALYRQAKPVGLRQLARLADVHPHSAERMLKSLVEEGVVLRERMGARILFRKQASHPDWSTLAAVFDAAERSQREYYAGRLNARAQTILPFIEEAGAMLKRARSSAGVA